MILYHVNLETGAIGVCKASVKQCPFGASTVHYPDAEQAQKAYEGFMGDKTHETLHKGTAQLVNYPSGDFEPLKGITGYYRLINAAAIPGSNLIVRETRIIGYRVRRFVQRGDGVLNRGWLELNKQGEVVREINSHGLSRRYFLSNNFKDFSTTTMRAGLRMELMVPPPSKISEWTESKTGRIRVVRYSADEEGERERRLAQKNWSDAVRVAQKGVKENQLRSWLETAYEYLDSRDRPSMDSALSLLRPRS